MTVSTIERQWSIVAAFRRQFKCVPEIIARAPGRVNLIGEHTDYNEGFVLPVAIDRQVLIAADRNAPDGMIQLYSLEYNEFDTFSIDEISFSTECDWSNYLKGVIACLKEQGVEISPFRACVTGNVPQGAGLSSSAALEVATAVLCNKLFGTALSGKEIALLAQKAENEFVGIRCGIMDQFVSSLAQSDAALLIDCRDLNYEAIPLHLSAQEVSIVITHTGVRRGLLGSKFNERRSECEEGLRLLKQSRPGLNSLRDLDLATLQLCSGILPDVIKMRVKHVVAENDRVQQAAALLREQNLRGFGELMIDSHNSLRKDYEVSCDELDLLVDLSLKTEGCLGARMTGAGFGGCTVALFEEDKVSLFLEQVLSQYEKMTGKMPSAYVCSAVAGAGIIS